MEPLDGARRRSAVAKFLDRYEAGAALLPDSMPLPYDTVPSIQTSVWRFQLFSEAMVEGELRELTNLLNQWMGALRRWHVWIEVLGGLPDEDRWGIEWEFVEPLAFMCMFQPSAARDRFIFVATNALHQIRLARNRTMSDELLGDPTPPKFRKHYPRRSKKEEQLTGMAGEWPAGAAFMEALVSLDDATYEGLTSDFRNCASHAIAPRFSVGITSIVRRERVQLKRLEKQSNDTYKEVTVFGQMTTQYGYGGTLPLAMRDAWTANLAQFESAKTCFFAYVALLQEAIATMPKRPKESADE